MQIGDFLYFAPGIRFQDVKLDSPEVVKQFQARVESYYLEPARMLANMGHAFGAVALLASAIDAMARFERPAGEGNRSRYIAWTEQHVPSLSSHPLAKQFYEDFRCGVVHEGRAKAGCVFVPSLGSAVKVEGGLMGVNPEEFAPEISQVLNNFCTRIESDQTLLRKFQAQLRTDFLTEIPAISNATSTSGSSSVAAHLRRMDRS